MDERLRQCFKEAQHAYVKVIFDNIGLGIIWTDDYRELLKRAGNAHTPLQERINLYNLLWAREVSLGSEARIALAIAKESDRLAREEQEASREVLSLYDFF